MDESGGGDVLGEERLDDRDGGSLSIACENVTNEASFHEDVSTLELHKSVHVTANSGDDSGLDTVQTKPAAEWGGDTVLCEKKKKFATTSRGLTAMRIGTSWLRKHATVMKTSPRRVGRSR